MLKKKHLALSGALIALLSSPALALTGTPVEMTDQGLRHWVQVMPDDNTLMNRLAQVAEECDCDETGNSKAIVEYFVGLFGHNGYSYGETVVEYLAATYGEGKYEYEYEGSSLLQPSGIVHFVMPAIGLIQDGEKDWLVNSGAMSAEAAWRAEEMLNSPTK